MEQEGSLNALDSLSVDGFANVACDTEFSIINIKEVPPSCIKLTVSAGPSFFIGLHYLSTITADRLVPGALFKDESALELLDAAVCYNAEYAAMGYLSRSEQCRNQLERKLLTKNHSKEAVRKALDYLEHRGFLSDARFAAAWLRNRAISHAEGRSRLAAELATRGIDRHIANQAIEDFFADNNEELVFKRAVDKCKRLGKSPEKTVAYLTRCGFPFNLIKTLNYNSGITIKDY